MATASNVRKRKGTIRGSISRLTNRLSALEDQVAEPSTFDLAQGLATKLAEMDHDYVIVSVQGNIEALTLGLCPWVLVISYMPGGGGGGGGHRGNAPSPQSTP